MNSNARTVGAMLATAFISMAGAAAQAADTLSPIPEKLVSYRDLNLDTPEGVAVLYNRLRHAAYAVCDNPRRYALSESKLRTCMKNALSQAVAEIDKPALTSLYRSKTGQSDTKVVELARAR